MPSTFLTLTNKVLNKFNEVNLDSSTFPSTRGVQSAAKDGIIDAISEIDKVKVRWPFNAAEHTLTLSPGVEEYAWPTNFKHADYKSFQIQKNPTLNVGFSRVKPINRTEWYQNLRDSDQEQGLAGAAVPQYVFPAHGIGFGLSPTPDQAYDLKYRYYTFTTLPVLYSDASTIPTQWDYLIVQGAMYHMYMFYDNPERAAAARNLFEDELKDMTTTLIPADFYAFSTMVNRGGGVNRNSDWSSPNG